MEQPTSPLLGFAAWVGTLMVPIGSLALLLRTKGAKAFRSDLVAITAQMAEHEKKDDNRFAEYKKEHSEQIGELSKTVAGIDKTVTILAVMQKEDRAARSIDRKASAETRAIIEKIRDHQLEQKQ